MNFLEYLASLDEGALVIGACLGTVATVLLTFIYVGLGALNDRRKKRKVERLAEEYGKHSFARKRSSTTRDHRTDTRSIHTQTPKA